VVPTDPYADADTNRHTDGDLDPHPNAHTNRDGNARTFCDAHRYSDPAFDSYLYSDARALGYIHTHGNRDSIGCHRDGHPDAYRNRDGDGDSHDGTVMPKALPSS